MKVLTPVDITHPHEDLIEHLNWMLPLKDQDVILLFVKEILPSYERIVETTADFPDDWTHQIDKKAHKFFEPLEEKLKKAGAKVSTEIVSGPPERMIANVARDHNTDIIATTPGQHSNVQRFFMGSTSSSVVRIAPGTILLLRDHKGHDELKHVVIGVDGTDQSDYALKTAVKQFGLAERNVKVTVVNAVSIPPMVAMLSPAEVVVSVEKNMEMEGETIVATALKNLQDLGVKDAEPRVVKGDPATELMRFAEQSNAQLIVVGAQGHSFVEHVLVGSTASRVASHAKCAAAIVKMPAKK